MNVIKINGGFTFDDLSDKTKEALNEYKQGASKGLEHILEIGSQKFIEMMFFQYSAEESDEILKNLPKDQHGDVAKLFVAEYELQCLIDIGEIIETLEKPEGLPTPYDLNGDNLPEMFDQLSEKVAESKLNEFIVFNDFYTIANYYSKRKMSYDIVTNPHVKAFKNGFELLRLTSLAIAMEDDQTRAELLDPVALYFEMYNEHCANGCEIQGGVNGSLFRITKADTNKLIKTFLDPSEVEANIREQGLKVVYLEEESCSPTIDGYANALNRYIPMQSKKQANYAGILPVFDGIEFKEGKLFDRSGNDVTESYIRRMTAKPEDGGALIAEIQGTPRDGQLLTALFTATVRHNAMYNEIPHYLDIDAKSLISFLYGDEGHGNHVNRKLSDISGRLDSLNENTRGIVYSQRRTVVRNRSGVGEFQKEMLPTFTSIANYNRFDVATQTIRIDIPYFENALKQMLRVKSEMDQSRIEYNETHKRKKNENSPYYHNLNTAELDRQRDKPAIEIVKLITQRIVKSGAYVVKMDPETGIETYVHTSKREPGKKPVTNVPVVHWSEIFKQVPELTEGSNPSRSFRKHLENVYKYLIEFTHVTEEYPEIIFPGHNLDMNKASESEWANWFPTLKQASKRDLYFYLTTYKGGKK